MHKFAQLDVVLCINLLCSFHIPAAGSHNHNALIGGDTAHWASFLHCCDITWTKMNSGYFFFQNVLSCRICFTFLFLLANLLAMPLKYLSISSCPFPVSFSFLAFALKRANCHKDETLVHSEQKIPNTESKMVIAGD